MDLPTRFPDEPYLYPILLGESILPFRVFCFFEGVVPVTPQGEVLDATKAANQGFDGLYGWMHKAEALWTANAKSKDMTLTHRWNYHNELSCQFPIAPLRVVYAKAGSQPAACIVRDRRAVVENRLFTFFSG